MYVTDDWKNFMSRERERFQNLLLFARENINMKFKSLEF